MFKHYLATALRHFRQHKITSALNIACLTFGLACFIGVYGLIVYLQASDRHVPHADRTFVMVQRFTVPGSDAVTSSMPSTGWALARYLDSDFPQLEAIARMTNVAPMASGASLKAGSAGMDAKVRFADAAVIDVLHLPLLAGDRNALGVPRSIVLSADSAVRLFGAPGASLGRQVILFGSTPLTVTGVLDAIPQPSHLSTEAFANPFQRFDVLVSMDVYESRQANAQVLQSWQNGDISTYIVLPQDGSLTADGLRRQLPAFVQRYTPPSTESIELGVAPLASVALSSFENGLRFARSGVSAVTLLYMLGGLVLLIACLNYANLALAQSATHTREIGMRRVVGATRTQVMVQCLVEAGLAALFGAAAAIALLTLLLLAVPVLSEQLNAARFFLGSVLPSWQLWVLLFATVGVVTLVAGAYPAFVLSTVRPVRALRKGQEKTARRRTAAVIVAAQFVSASVLLIAILVMQAQSSYIRKAALATLDDPFLVLANYSDTPANYETLRAELLRQPQIKAVTAASAAPWEIHNMGGPASFSVSPDPLATRRAASRNFDNTDFFPTLDFELLAGRLLSNGRASDDSQLSLRSPGTMTNAIVDRAFVDDYGWTPQQAVGRTVYYWRKRDGQEIALPVTIVGVVESKPLSVIQFGINANVFFFDPAASRSIIVRVAKEDIRAGVRAVDAAWNAVAPNVAIQRQFADEALDKAMWMLDMISLVFGAVAAIGIVIAMLGLTGVAMHATHRRTHEIGVRKTLGASARDVFGMLLLDFTRPVVVANLIAWPIAYLLMRAYLSIFTHSAGLSVVPFFISFAVTFLVAALAVAAQVSRAARLKPGHVLRYE